MRGTERASLGTWDIALRDVLGRLQALQSRAPRADLADRLGAAERQLAELAVEVRARLGPTLAAEELRRVQAAPGRAFSSRRAGCS